MTEIVSKSIVVIDDCEDNLILMELLLASEGYTVCLANSGLKGLSEVYRVRPDLIILDLMMPDISGLEVTRHLKENSQLATIPILLLTANASFSHKNAADADAISYKPFNISNILEKVKLLIVPNRCQKTISNFSLHS